MEAFEEDGETGPAAGDGAAAAACLAGELVPGPRFCSPETPPPLLLLLLLEIQSWDLFVDASKKRKKL